MLVYCNLSLCKEYSCLALLDNDFFTHSFINKLVFRSTWIGCHQQKSSASTATHNGAAASLESKFNVMAAQLKYAYAYISKHGMMNFVYFYVHAMRFN